MSAVDRLSALDLEESLPSLPTAALEVLRVCQDPDAEIDDLAAALTLDPVLASRVLRLANSAAYRRRNEVTSLQRAAVMLGMRTLKVVALGFTLTSALPQQGVWAGLDLVDYWHRSLVNAVIARSLARASKNPLAEEAFLCGLLSEIGKLGLTLTMPEAYGPVVAEGIGWPSDELERTRLRFPATAAGEVMLRSWHVPELVVTGATFAGRTEELPEDAPHDARPLAELVGLARTGTAVLFGHDPAGLVRFTQEAERLLGIAGEDAELLVAELESEVEEAAGLLSLHLPPGVSYQTLIDQARDLIATMTLDSVMAMDEGAPADEPARAA
jgi:HD-like signal output (HDOD) protein